MAKRSSRGRLPHVYGVHLNKVPDTHTEPFVAYRSWNWTAEGVTSLNGSPWTPKVAFQATCRHADDLRSMQAAALTPSAKKYWQSKAHHVPEPSCTCGMYAGINMQHLIDINYIRRRIHGEVWLWGRLYRHTLGWRAQYAYPKFFVVPANIVPFDMTLAQQSLARLVEFDVDIYVQPDREAKVSGERIPLWIKDFGYSQQGLSWLVEKRKQWYTHKSATRSPRVTVSRCLATWTACE